MGAKPTRRLSAISGAVVLLALAAHPAAADGIPQRIAQLDRLALPTSPPPPPIVDGVPFLVRFTGTVRGLIPGASVEVRGIRIGDVISVGVDYAAATNSFVVPVKIQLQPSLFPAAGPHPNGADETYGAVDLLVRRGLRAQVAQTLFITGETIVTLDIESNAPSASLGRGGPIPEIPAGPTRADMIAEKLQPLLDKLADAPIDQVFADIEAASTALKDLATGPELRGTLDELRGAAADLRGVVDRLGVKSDTVMANLDATMKSTSKLIDRTSETLATVNHQVGDRSPLLADLRGLVEELSGTARSMRLLAEYLERNPSALVTGKTETRP